MKIFDSRKSIVLASIGVLFASLALVSCEKREEPLLNEMAKYSKTIVFTEQQQQTRASYIDYTTAMPSAEYVLRTEEATDSMFLSAYVTDLESEQLMTRAEETTTANLEEFRILAYNVGAGGDLSINQNLSKRVGKKNDGTWSYGAVENQDDINWSELGSNNVKFFAYANLDNDEISSTQFRLTLPTNAADQADIIVAEAEKSYNSSTTEQVPLNFNHILAGIKFVVGNKTDISGYIKSIKVKNVVSQGVYDIQTGYWSELSLDNKNDLTAASGLTSNGNTDEQVGSTLMVIPQNLNKSLTDDNQNIKIEIVFHANGGDRTLFANLSGSWAAGQMYTYKISNHKIDLLNFTSQPRVQDAHYVIYPVEVSLKSGLKTATLTVAADDRACVEMRESITPYEELGYWIDNNEYIRLKNTNFKNGSDKENIKERDTDGVITWSNINADIQKTIYLFIPENISNQDRTITLTLSGETDNGGAANIKTQNIKQFCPTSTGCERIEEVDLAPWGPYWTITGNGDSKVVKYTPNITNLSDLVNYIIVGIYGLNKDNWPHGVTFKYETKWWSLGADVLQYIEIDYTDYLQFEQDARDNGYLNTIQIFADNLNTNGANMDELTNLQNTLNQYGFNPPSGVTVKQEEVDNSAIVVAVKKNKYKLNVVSGEDGNLLEFTIPSENINWYLPSISEIEGTSGKSTVLTVKNESDESPLNGTYWSSSISTGNLSMSHSQAYTCSNGPKGDYIRTEKLSVRAVRAVTSDATFQNQ